MALASAEIELDVGRLKYDDAAYAYSGVWLRVVNGTDATDWMEWDDCLLESQDDDDPENCRQLEKINNCTLVSHRLQTRLQIQFALKIGSNELSLNLQGVPCSMIIHVVKQKGRVAGQAVEVTLVPKPDPMFCGIRQAIFDCLTMYHVLDTLPEYMYCQFAGNGNPIDASFPSWKLAASYESRRWQTLMLDAGLFTVVPGDPIGNTGEKHILKYTTHSACMTFAAMAGLCGNSVPVIQIAA
ncbi:hypothetical protein BDR26DRAFT_930399 [Obelidium mucronatum]|nr:hypothetical protein BDR26DRAFT_930399 [Obelidium mucronatum]